MSDLLKVPKPHPENKSALADFVEIECLRKVDGNVSTMDIGRILVRETDSYGDEAINQFIKEVFGELGSRAEHCGEPIRYPYNLTRTGELLERRSIDDCEKEPAFLVYWYLLLSTRMNMRTEKVHGGHDATAIFERLCMEVAVRYWGGPSPHVRAIVFGTGRKTEEMGAHEEIDQGVFQSAVNELCKAIGEGGGFRSRSNSRVCARDGKLDIVVWRGFADKRHGQLIGFGQCKTGRNWEKDLVMLQPDDFSSKWIRDHFAVPPVRLYFVADRVIERWYNRCRDGGILFDRCRIMEHAIDLPTDLLRDIRSWVAAALKSQGLALS